MSPEHIHLHVKYILSLEEDTSKSDVFYFTDHKRLSGVYWALTSLELLGSLNLLSRQAILDYVMSCYHPEVLLREYGSMLSTVSAEGQPRSHETRKFAAFGGNADQDPHLLYTLSGIQVLALYDALDLIDCEAIVAYVAALQQENGSFAGDEWGEVDSRFSYCALLTLAILGRMDAVNLQTAVDYVMSCVNFDGGFGCIPGAESHAGQIFCCVGALKLCNALDQIDDELLGWWLCERQLPCGGFNGRPDKKEDVCYSWWVLSSLAMLDKLDWIDSQKLVTFIQECQDPDAGGIADRPGDMADVFHTFFGLAGLSLLGDQNLESIDPMYALPKQVVSRLPPPRTGSSLHGPPTSTGLR
jgi:geranylgeranyl transferase type-2 subunit beta